MIDRSSAVVHERRMSDRGAQAFERLAQLHWTDAELHRVTEGKDLMVLPTTAPTLLRTIGLLHRDASMPPPQVRKFLQLNHMLRLLRPPLLELMQRPDLLRIVDAGCGLSYLTLSLAWCLQHIYRHPAALTGVDRDPDRIEACRASAQQAGLEQLTFRCIAIDQFEPSNAPHVVLALHACDTATDHAIALGLRSGADLIAVAPCCQAELARHWTALPELLELPELTDQPLEPLLRTPHLRREAAATVTDAMRMLLLQAVGYETRVVEFVPSRHTPKNTLIRAMQRHTPDQHALRQYIALRDATGGAGIALERAEPLATMLLNLQ